MRETAVPELYKSVRDQAEKEFREEVHLISLNDRHVDDIHVLGILNESDWVLDFQ